MSDKAKTAKYVVTSKFAKFKVGQVIELVTPCPSAAQPHVRLHVEEVDSSDPKVDSEALEALGEVYTLLTGDKAGKKKVKTLKDGILKVLEESNANTEENGDDSDNNESGDEQNTND